MLRWIRNGVLGLVGLVVVLAVGGVLYQFISTVIDEHRYPPPGKLVDVGGHRLHLYCTGEGSPTVVLDAMGFGWSTHWSLVQPEIAKLTRVCSYDRAGYGWSEPGPLPRTAQQVANELHTLLTNAQVAGPYVLVGHSFSGYTVRIFRHQYPNEVAGIVMVDAASGGSSVSSESPKDPEAQARYERIVAVGRVLASVGVVRVAANLDKLPFLREKQAKEVSPEILAQLHAGLARTSFTTTFAQEEMAALPESVEEARATGSLGDLPLVIITANGPIWMEDLPPGFTNQAQHKKFWLESQRRLAALSTRSTQIFADQSSHFMQFDQPEVVVDGIRRILDMVKK